MGREKLGEIWVRSGKITLEQLESALQEQRLSAGRLGDILKERGLLTDHDIGEARALQLDVPYCDVFRTKIASNIISLVSPSIARTYLLLPIEVVGDRLRVAMANPADLEPLDLLQRMTRLRPEPLFAEEHALRKAIESYYSTIATTVGGETIDSVMDDIAVGIGKEDLADLDDAVDASEQAPVVTMVNLLITEAVRLRASDIHLEPRKANFEVRHRIDGVLRKARTFPKSSQAAFISRLKIMAHLDISEKRLPQDGRIALNIDGRSIDLRVSTLPIHYGERLVMRVLEKGASIRGLEELDMSEGNLARFESLIRRPFGIILVTGPTGSGKTTTLYSALSALKDETTNILTCEDPIEYDLDGINQSAVHERIGLTFARQLRAILRQDPDVVLVGEIRDVETAEIAIRAAMTGHLVLSTLHANDAPTAVTRLLDMGVPPFLIASALVGVVAQRLTRRLCQKCRKEGLPTPAQVGLLGLDPSETVWHPAGCQICDDKGYKGRIAVHEVMICDEDLSRMIMGQVPGSKLRAAALDSGMTSMREDGLAKVRSGITSPDEVIRRISLEVD